jgi:hypothetical protein
MVVLADEHRLRPSPEQPDQNSHLVAGLLPPYEPLHKLCQPDRKRLLNWTVGHPQTIPKRLKLMGA